MVNLKKFFILYAIIFTIVSLTIYILAMISLGLSDNFIFRPFILLVGLLVISILIALSISIFQASWGNGVLNIILSYLIIIPIPFIIRVMFMNRIFRLFHVIYFLLGIYLIGYLLFTFINHLINKKVKNTLNELLKEKKEKTSPLD
jgi:hypothetical protein